MIKLKILFFTLILINSAAHGEALLADRYYVKSVLVSVFGESAHNLIDEKIIKNGAHFGGPCDMYRQVRTGKLDQDIQDQSTFCQDGATGTRLPLIAPNNMFRESIMSLVCSELVNQTASLNHALKKANTSSITLPSSQSVGNIITLFNPVAENSRVLASSLVKNKSIKKLTPQNQWKIIIKSLCTDLSWQIL